MALTDINYSERAKDAGLNVYFIAEGDKDYNIRKESVNKADFCTNCYSIAKAFTVLGIGMLYDRGLLTPQDKVTSILSDYLPENMDPKWNTVTLENLMLHESGLGRDIIDVDNKDASELPTDFLKLALSEPLPGTPGVDYRYTDTAFYVLGRVVSHLAGCDIADFLRPTLMETMKFKEFAWSVCPQGYSLGATGLFLRTEDVVKLGILYLNGGMWKGTRILSEEWVKIAIDNEYELKDKGQGWRGKGGMRGQMMAFNLERGLAIAWHSFENKVPFDAIVHD